MARLSTEKIARPGDGYSIGWKIENFVNWEMEGHGRILSSKVRGVPFHMKMYRIIEPEGERMELRLYAESNHRNCDLLLRYVDSQSQVLKYFELQNQCLRKDRYCVLHSIYTFRDVALRKYEFMETRSVRIHCRIRKTDGTKFDYPVNFCNVRTDIQVFKKGFTFPVPPPNVSVCFDAAILKNNDYEDLPVCLEDSSTAHEGIVVVVRQRGVEVPFQMHLGVVILDANQIAVNQVENAHTFQKYTGRQTWKFPLYFSKEELYRGLYLLEFSIKTIPPVKTGLLEYTSSGNAEMDGGNLDGAPFLNVLSKDFLSLYQDPAYSDFELTCEGCLFQVHKTLLVARSPVFKRMLSTDMLEAGSDCVEIADIDRNTLSLFLAFLYSGKLDNLEWDCASRLYYAADKYQVMSLKEGCSSLLRSSLSPSNVCDILSLADRHQDEVLLGEVHNYIVDNFKVVIRSKEWNNSMNSDPVLMGKTLQLVCDKKIKNDDNACE